MKIQVDENGYVENYVLVGEGSACNINVELPEGFEAEHYAAYRLIYGVLTSIRTGLRHCSLRVGKMLSVRGGSASATQ